MVRLIVNEAKLIRQWATCLLENPFVQGKPDTIKVLCLGKEDRKGRFYYFGMMVNFMCQLD